MVVCKDNMEESLLEIKRGVHEIYYGPALIISRYMLLYTYIVNFYQRNSDKYEEVYNRIKGYLSEVVVGVLQQLDTVGGEENFLAFYMEKWEWYKARSKTLNGVFSPVNRASNFYHWVVLGRFTDALENLTTFLWKDLLLKPRLTKLTTSTLKLIEQHRNGGSINYELIKAYLHHFEEMDGKTMMNGFEEAFLRETTMYYSKEVITHLQHHSKIEFFKKMEKFAKQEQQLAQLCLLQRTAEPLNDTCENLLVTQQLDLYISEFNKSLRSDNMELLRIIYQIVNLFDDSLGEIMTCFEVYVVSQFDAICNHEVAQTFFKNVDMGFEIIFDVHRKYSNLITAAFSDDFQFLALLDGACTDFIDKVLDVNVDPARELAEFFAYYFDSLMENTRRKLDDIELEQYLTHAMRLMENVYDVDTFPKLYFELFSTRMITLGPVSETAEISMIKKLTELEGFEGAHQFRRMYEDAVLSKNLAADFKRHVEAENSATGLDFNVQIHHSFRCSFANPGIFILPLELTQCAIKFSEFYKMRFNSRHLSWQNHLSKGEIQANCYGMPYNFQASTYQMTVLLMFNDKDSYSVAEIAKKTLIGMGIVVSVVRSLIKAKLLISGDGNQKDIFTSKSVVKLCQVYENKELRVNIMTPAASANLFKIRRYFCNDDEDE